MRISGYRRLAKILVVLLCFALLTGYILFSLGDSISFFQSPSSILSNGIHTSELRIGGLVSDIKRFADRTEFMLSDATAVVEVVHEGLSPALMREGIEVIVIGKMHGNKIQSRQILIKHDERYYPPEDLERY